MANGRVFQFGQTQKLACIPNKKAAAQTEKAMERVREREWEQETNRIWTCSHWLFGITQFTYNFGTNYMNYSGFRFNVFVINIFRIGISWRMFSMGQIHTHTHISKSFTPEHSKQKEALSMLFDFGTLRFTKIHTITIKKCCITITRHSTLVWTKIGHIHVILCN